MLDVHMRLDPVSCVVVTEIPDVFFFEEVLRLIGYYGEATADTDILVADVVVRWDSYEGMITIRYEDNHAFDRSDQWMCDLIGLVSNLRAA